MTHRIKPHTPEWFAALRSYDPRQALRIEQVTSLAGAEEVCGVCGDTPARDYEVLKPAPADNAVVTCRLCDDCLSMRNGNGEGFISF